MSNTTYLTFNIARNGNLLETHTETVLPQGKLVIDAQGTSFVSLRYNINSALIYARDELGILFTRPYKMVWRDHRGRLEERVYSVDDNLPYHASFVGDYSVEIVKLEVLEEEENEFWNDDDVEETEYYDELDEYEEEPYLEEEEY
ncbi:Hypothetical protein BRZCDTV_194 [Brazilian cedratvirus IHUMI]|uniref:Uncharacterized protein n=1 Tax=Brazilian cedratvirus IHUMI TaxID=2126980 RepID=A0A2R8FE22_9VIRU|nr:Hypothetical protein BRZCDTV_194 [Brazilian cedratvirus IHUMI]